MDRRLWLVAGLTAASVATFVAVWRHVDPPTQMASLPSPQTPPAASTPAPAAASPEATAAVPPAAPSAAEPAAKPSTAAKPSPYGAIPPSFDVVRVEPDGSAVVAGRAAPHAEVTLFVDGAPVATQKADDAGQFVILPPTLAAGSHALSLGARADGREVASAQTVTVLGASAPAARPEVALAEAGAPTRMLSDAPPAPGAPTRIRTVEAEQGGAFFASGQAAPGAAVRLYLNGSLVAETPARADGGWSVRIEKGMTPGPYAVRADALDAGGKVSGRAEVEFVYPAASLAAAPPAATTQPAPEAVTSPAAPTGPGAASTPPASAAPVAEAKPVAVAPPVARPADASVPEVRTATVSRGDSLWRLSAKIYGSGLRYTEIYGANAAQIRNPDLIYPGQVLVAPAAAKEAPPKG